MAFCTHCGVVLIDGAKFCRSCGAQVDHNDVAVQRRPEIRSSQAPPNTSVSHHSAGSTEKVLRKKQGMRWATWCIYISYPLGGVITLNTAVKFFPGANGLILGITAITQFITSFLLLKKKKLGWYLNFFLWFAFVLSWSFQSRDIVADTVLAVIAFIILYIPNAVYWYKRKWVFETEDNDLFSADWRQFIPIVAFIIIIPLLAAIALPAYQAYVNKSKEYSRQSAMQIPSDNRNTLPYAGRAWSGNASDQFDSVDAITAKARSIPQLNEQRTWAAVIEWQKYFMGGGNDANVALYMGVDHVLEALQENRGICWPGEKVVVDAASASQDVPVGTRLVKDDCDSSP